MIHTVADLKQKIAECIENPTDTNVLANVFMFVACQKANEHSNFDSKDIAFLYLEGIKPISTEIVQEWIDEQHELEEGDDIINKVNYHFYVK